MVASYHRRDISDKAWALIEPYTIGNKGTWGGNAKDTRLFINAVFWILRTGAPWCDLPPDYCNWNTVQRRFCRWRDKGIGETILEAIVDGPISSQSRYPDFEGKRRKLTDNARVCKPLKNQHFPPLKVENPENPDRARSSKEIRFWGEKSPLGRRWGELGEKSQSNADDTYRYRTSKSRWLSA